MDKDVLVKEGQTLIRRLDESNIKPKGAIWVYSSESDSWRLWIIPSDRKTDKFEFYRTIAEIISRNRKDMPSLDVGLVELKGADHPAVQGLGRVLRMEGLGAAAVSNNSFNGVYLPDGVVLRMAI